MRIIGVLSWFDESPTWLARTVASCAKLCDQIVAVDGRYELFAHDMDWSPAPQHEAVVAAAEGVGLPLTLHVPRAPFAGNEVEKRNLLLRLARVHAELDVDWIFVLDADEYVIRAAPDIRERLAGTSWDAITCSLEEYFDPFSELAADGGVARILPLPNVWRVEVRRLYRALPGLAYVGTHFNVGGHDVTGNWEWVSRPTGQRQCEAYDLGERLIIRHENPRRPLMRREQAATYYAQRDELEIEDQDALAPAS